jgi:hypothetical protein
MRTITIIPKNEESVPLITELLNNNEWVLDFEINENGVDDGYIPHTPNEETLQAIREVENGDVIEIGTFEDYLKWVESV